MPYSSFGAFPILTGTTSVPPTCIPVATSIASMSTVTTVTHSMSFGRVDRSTLTYYRVGWIQNLYKNGIIREIQKFEIATEGKMKELRERFVEFWHNSARVGTLGGLGGPVLTSSGLHPQKLTLGKLTIFRSVP